MPVTLSLVQSVALVIGTSGAIGGYVLKLWYDHKRTVEKVESLEDTLKTLNLRIGKVAVESVKSTDHDRNCMQLRNEVYKDVANLEHAITRVERRLDKGEEIRDLARAEDSKWREDIGRDVTEISTLLKNELLHLREHRRYEGP